MAGAAAPGDGSSWRNGVYVPQMPWFEPSSEPSAKASMLSQTVREGDHFSFPADRDFWNNFVTQSRLYPGAMEPPHFHVDASHTDESLLVNQEFLRRFVSGWERANPHVVKVSTPQGATTFHSSEEFWNRFVTMAGQRSRERAARGEYVAEDTVVQSSMYPGMPPIKTSQRDWLEICQSWEAEKGITPGEKARQAQQRWDQIRGGGEDHLLGSQNSMLDQQRAELADKAARLEAQRRQLGQLEHELEAARAAAQAAQMRGSQAGSELQAAQAAAERLRQELQSLRQQQQQMQEAWESERGGMERRLLAMESAIGGLQHDVQRQREQGRRELAAKERELQGVRQQGELGDLRKELQIREHMQEEICRAREEAMREAEEAARDEALRRSQQELDELRMVLRDAPIFGAGLPAHCAAPCGPVDASPRRVLVRCAQRTVATQTPPRARDLGPQQQQQPRWQQPGGPFAQQLQLGGGSPMLTPSMR